jgi:hypothetical protein
VLDIKGPNPKQKYMRQRHRVPLAINGQNSFLSFFLR